jgi:hypothetical protein
LPNVITKEPNSSVYEITVRGASGIKDATNQIIGDIPDFIGYEAPKPSIGQLSGYPHYENMPPAVAAPDVGTFLISAFALGAGVKRGVGKMVSMFKRWRGRG